MGEPQKSADDEGYRNAQTLPGKPGRRGETPTWQRYRVLIAKHLSESVPEAKIATTGDFAPVSAVQNE